MKKINYTGSSKLISRIVDLINRKVPMPTDSQDNIDWGTNGQVLITDGSGSTSWGTATGGGTQSDWEETDTSSLAYIKNKPTIPADENVKQTATTGNYDFRVLLSATATDGDYTGVVKKNTNLKYNASTGNFQVPKINGVDVGNAPEFTDIKVLYGTCGTAASDPDKKVVLSGTTLTDAQYSSLPVGTFLIVKYANTNSASNCTLSIVNTATNPTKYTTPASFYFNDSVYTSNSQIVCGYAGRIVLYMWDGTYWVWAGRGTEPTVNNGQLSLKLNDAAVGSFTANQSGNVEYNLLPTELRNMFKPEGGSGNRPTTANITPNNNASVQHFLATSTMTTGAPPTVGNILHFSWDGNNRYAKQLAILNSSMAGLATRFQTGTGQNDWSEWLRYYPDGYQWNTYSTDAITATAEEHADLDDFKTPGNYSSVDSSVSQYIDNAPTTTTGFNLIVMRITNNGNRIRQIAFANASTAIYTRYYANSTWSSWVNIATTYSALTASALKTGTATTLRTVRADYLNSGIKQIAQERVESPNTAVDVGKSNGYNIAGDIPVYESFLTKSQTYQYNTDSAMQEQYYVKMPFTSEYGSNRFIIYEADFWLGSLTSATRYKMEPENISMSMSSGDDEAVITVNFKAINEGNISGALSGHIKFSEYID